MKINKMLIALALCAGMQVNISFGSEVLQAEGPAPIKQSFYQQYAPQRMQDLTGYISKQAKSAYNTVNSWSTKKKIAVASAIVASLAAIYNRDQIMQWASNIFRPEWMDSYEALVRKKFLADIETNRLLNNPKKGEGFKEYKAAQRISENLSTDLDFTVRGLENAGVSGDLLWKLRGKIYINEIEPLKKIN